MITVVEGMDTIILTFSYFFVAAIVALLCVHCIVSAIENRAKELEK